MNEMNGKLLLDAVMCSADITAKQILIKNAILDDPKIKAYQKAKVEIAVTANCRFVDKGTEIVMEQLYTEDQSEALHNLDKAIEAQTRAIIQHYT